MASKNKKKITVKQKRVLDFIKKEIRENGFPPSIREICTALELNSTSSVHSHLTMLEDKGFIRRSRYKNRTIEILEPDFYANPDKVVNVPIVGKVTAGEPILAVENIEDSFAIPAELASGRQEVFMLRVQGSSMIEKGILNNDLVLVSKQPTAENGDIVVALLDDSATVKQFYKEKDHVRLQPANPEYEPIITRDVEIAGKVIGLYRRYK